MLAFIWPWNVSISAGAVLMTLHKLQKLGLGHETYNKVFSYIHNNNITKI